MNSSVAEDQASASVSRLLAFRAENVRSFRDGLELPMLAMALADEGVPRSVTWHEGGRPVQVLPTAGIFGANASGKSNVLRAMSDMRRHVLYSFSHGDPEYLGENKELGAAMLSKDIIYGMNLLTLVGLFLTGFGLTLRRMGRVGLALCLGVMGIGTALVLVGLYASGWSR
jgi:hypothetical protein